MLVGDRGLWTQTQIENLRQHRGLGWISALRAPALRRLADGGHLQLSLFDKKNLAEIHSPDYPGERLVACYNPLLAEQRGRKRGALLAASEKEFERIEAEVARRKRTPLSAAEIGRKAGRVLDRYKMGKHFKTTIGEGEFRWQRRQADIKREAELDGIYVIRSSEKKADLKAADAVRSYKSLARVERVFRCMKGADLRVRPERGWGCGARCLRDARTIAASGFGGAHSGHQDTVEGGRNCDGAERLHHDRGRRSIAICEGTWFCRRRSSDRQGAAGLADLEGVIGIGLGPGLDAPPDQDGEALLLERFPHARPDWLAWAREVAENPPTGTIHCLGRLTPEGLPVHSFATLLDALATRCQNTCRVVGEGSAATFEQRTAPTPLQKRAFELLGL